MTTTMFKSITLTLIGLSAALVPALAKAEFIYQDPFSYDPVNNGPTYNSGTYRTAPDWQQSPLYEGTLIDNGGNLYDCDILGSCRPR